MFQSLPSLTLSCFVAVLQIRAANLSGDCTLGMEFVRGNLSEALVGQHKRCVRRRALLSVSLNPYCQVGIGFC
jgi:inner membrane protease ATP23